MEGLREGIQRGSATRSDRPEAENVSAIMVCMIELERRSVRFPSKYQSAGLGIVGLVVCAGVMTGCSVFRDYTDDTCDGGKPVGSIEQAGKDLVAAAYAVDRDGVCRVTHPFPGGVWTMQWSPRRGRS